MTRTEPRSIDAPPHELVRWALEAVGASSLRRATSMSQSGRGGPWRLEVARRHGDTEFVLKAARPDPEEEARFATAVAALEVAAGHDVPAPRPVAHDLTAEHGWLAVLTSLLPGTSSIAADISPERLRALGAAAAHIHLASGTPSGDLPLRARSLDGYDLNEGAQPTRSTPLLQHAREVISDGVPGDEVIGFVHGDFWQGNTLWDGDRYSGAVDWDFAGFGPAGIDLGSLRADVVVLHGPAAAAEVLAGWEQAAGGPAPNLAWWDLVAGVNTPDDMNGWLPNFHAQGRTDLDLETVTRRRDDYVEQALRRVD